MKKISTLLAALAIGLSGAAVAQKQEAAKPAAPAAAKSDAKAAPAKPDAKAPAANKPDGKAAPATDAKKEPLDLNSATDKELAALPKIGEAKAKAIIAGRPWSGKDDLVTKKVLSQAEYDAIKDMIVAKQPKKDDTKKEPAKKEPPKK